MEDGEWKKPPEGRLLNKRALRVTEILNFQFSILNERKNSKSNWTCCFSLRCLTFAGGIINFHARLDVIAVHVKANAFAVVLDRPRLHLHARGDKIAALKHRRDPIEHMVAGFLYIVSDHILKWQHTLDIEVSRAGDQVLLVGILGGKLPADQVTAIVISKYLYMFK